MISGLKVFEYLTASASYVNKISKVNKNCARFVHLLCLRADAKFPSLLKAYLLMFVLKLSMIKN